MLPVPSPIPLTMYQIIGIVLSIALPFAGALYGVFKYSVGRNITAIDNGYTDLKKEMSNMKNSLDDLKQSYGRDVMPRIECSTCRKECTARVEKHQTEIIEWMRRQDDKSDRLLVMIADRNRNQRFSDRDNA